MHINAGNKRAALREKGARDEAERSALLFRKCKAAKTEADRMRRQLKVVRGAYLMVVLQLTRSIMVKVAAARGIAEWRHSFWDEAVAASLDNMLEADVSVLGSIPEPRMNGRLWA